MSGRRVLVVLAASGLVVFLGVWLLGPRANRGPEAVSRLDASASSEMPSAAPSAHNPEPSEPYERYDEAMEFGMMREAHELAKTDKRRALALVLDAEKRWGNIGGLVEARRALLVTLLVDTGQRAEAEKRAGAFKNLYPRSQYLPLVEEAIQRAEPSPSGSGRAP